MIIKAEIKSQIKESTESNNLDKKNTLSQQMSRLRENMKPELLSQRFGKYIQSTDIMIEKEYESQTLHL